MRILLAFSLCITAIAADAPRLRLGDAVLPTRYALELSLAPDRNTFTGKIDIGVTIASPQDVIWLNAVNLTIKDARIGDAAAKVMPGNKQVIGISTGAALSPGSTTLHLTYEGSISRTSSAGLFELEEDQRWYLYSQFEPTDARRAFPCFDEPGFKVPWDISLRVPKDLMAVANTPAIEESEAAGGMKLVRFATTRPLPSYLVAVAVGPFDAVDLGKAGRKKTPMRIIVPHGKASEAKYAASAIPQLMTLLEDYFGIPFPYAKLDSLVMPISNFAMENAGLITYGQSLLLSAPEHDTIMRRRGCAIVAAHEMAHQWFGDLVTTAWWNDIWLNEAFATWMEGKIVEAWQPEWHLEADEVEERLGVMGSDSLVTSRSIRQPITAYDDIANAFDGITYQKGAAVIRMFERSIGEEKFRHGVQAYLKEYTDRTATSPDFLAAVSKSAGRNVAPAFSTFLDVAGVPVIHVDLNCDGKQPRVAIQQKRYLPIGSPGSSQQIWRVPVCVRYEAGGAIHSQCDMLTDPRDTMTLTAAHGCPAWIMANKAGDGYYRTLYTPTLLSDIVKTGIDHLSLAEKLTVLGDVAPLVKSGDLPVGEALSLSKRFAGSPEREIVDRSTSTASFVFAPYVPDDLLAKARAFIAGLFGERARQLGWKPAPGESDDDRLLRESLVPFVVRHARDQQLSAEATRLAHAWLKDHNAIDPELVSAVLSAAAGPGDREYFDSLVASLESEKSSRVRQAIFRALGSFRDPKLAWAGMELMLTGRYDARESFFALLFGPLRSRDTQTLPFEFVRKNIDALLAKLPREVGGDFASNLPGTGGFACDATGRAEVESFFKDRVKETTGGPRQLAQTLESIDLCIAQRAKIGPGLIAFLHAQ